MRQRLLATAILLVGTLCASTGWALELVMFRRAGCPWCAVWDRDIAAIYLKTEVGRRVPVRFVDLDHGRLPAVQLRSTVRFTPTFVLIDGGQEIGRIEGYPGEDFFWGLLENLVRKSAVTDGAASRAPLRNEGIEPP